MNDIGSAAFRFPVLFVLAMFLSVCSANVEGKEYEITTSEGVIHLTSEPIGSMEYFSVISLAEQLGFSVEWEPLLERLVLANAKGNQVTLLVGFEGYRFDNQIVRMQPPLRAKGMVLVNRPGIDRIASALGIRMNWQALQQDTPRAETDKELTLDEILSLLKRSEQTPAPNATAVESMQGKPVPTDTVVPETEQVIEDKGLSPFGPEGFSSDDYAKMIEEAKKELEQERKARPLKPIGYFTRIVLDPGHGGSDEGSIGPGGLTEANVCLDICERLKARLEKGTNLEVYLTRTADDKAPVANSLRAARANEVAGQMLVSIHCGAGAFEKQKGLVVYYPPPFLEQETDAAVQLVLDGSLRTDQEKEQLVVWRQAGKPYQSASVRLANWVYRKMLVLNPPEVDIVPRAGYLELLRSAEMPSCLVEIGVISNPAEERLLRQRTYRKEIVEALYSAIVAFLREQERNEWEP